MFRYDATDVLPIITVPVLVVTGEGDSTCLPEASEYMARVIPSAQLVKLGDSRHCGVFEFHEQFHAAVAEFLFVLEKATAADSNRGSSTISRESIV